MTDELEQPAQSDDVFRPKSSLPESDQAKLNSVYGQLVRRNKLVDEGTLRQAIEIAVADERGVLEVLVERERMSPDVRDGLVAIAKALSDSGDREDFAFEAPTPPTRQLAATDEQAPPPNLDQETVSIATGTTPAAMVPDNSQRLSSSFGDYEIISQIARGGMGIVYEARQISLNRKVALKKVLSGHLADGESIQRFRVEAEASAGLDHPGIVPVYDFGEVHGQHYYSMGFIEGRSLADRINESPLEPREAAELLVKIARAVAYANGKGVVHRDLKPGNVLLDQAGEPRVTDFGLAKQHSGEPGMTATGQILGTPSYMPPEQASGNADNVDQRADVYALGAILYATLSGRPPFQAANAMETLIQVKEKVPVPVRQLVPGAPRDLETICLKCLHKDPGRRYESCGDLADDLLRWLNGEPVFARRVSRAERAWKWCKRNPVLAGSVATIVTLLVVGSIVVLERQNAAHVDGLIGSLATADSSEVPELLDELGGYHWWATPRLRDRLDFAEEGSKHELHLALALLPDDSGMADILLRHLPAATPSQVRLIQNGLAKNASGEVTHPLWETVNDDHAAASSRMNAACVLALLDPSNAQWSEVDSAVAILLIKALAKSPRDSDALISMLEPVRLRLSRPIGDACRDWDLEAFERDWAATLLTIYAIDQPGVVCDVAMDADWKLFERLYPLIEAMASESVPVFLAEIERSLNETDDQLEKERIGKRQATAAIALMRLSQPDHALPVLSRHTDPRAGAWFVDRVDDYMVPPETILDCLDLSVESENDVLIQMILLQALGQFSEDELRDSIRSSLWSSLVEAYVSHPDSGLHGSLAWLLRQWGPSNVLTAILRARLAQESSDAIGRFEPRHWFLNSQGQTMIIVDAGEFMMGTEPGSDPDIEAHEIYHKRVINRTIAVAATEVTLAQFREFENEVRPMYKLVDYPPVRELSQTEDSPILAVSWHEAAWYCNWLSAQEGIPEDQWCYDTSDVREFGLGVRSKANFWELAGYRLPTEAEWEFFCRAGSESRYYFGYSDDLLPRYARFDANSDQRVWPVGHSIPNALGIFDLYGNAAEWCSSIIDLDYSQSGKIEESDGSLHVLDELNWTARPDDPGFVIRGGGRDWLAKDLRSATRVAMNALDRNLLMGFRVVKTHEPPQ